MSLVQARHSARLRGAIAGKHKTDVADADMLAGRASVFGLTPTTLPPPAQIGLRRAVRRRHGAVAYGAWLAKQEIHVLSATS